MSDNKKNFFEDVYEVVKLIPEGRVTSYGAIASYLGSKGSARMVGWALIASQPFTAIPAHRVVNRVVCSQASSTSKLLTLCRSGCSRKASK
ncbi:6-O-methylguanine DNA methyltransferase-like protein [Pontibacter virosus]|uniref:6-O-methylguanine DNA methyltransferase-like protein n=1 Tax=Pontibacter virosus TaxID=1765052 RepID=A0A2U1B3D1_9BACT|nr:6-O-methylguanine DNA methyltransferase-like protein [Pontibacter virosus]